MLDTSPVALPPLPCLCGTPEAIVVLLDEAELIGTFSGRMHPLAGSTSDDFEGSLRAGDGFSMSIPKNHGSVVWIFFLFFE